MRYRFIEGYIRYDDGEQPQMNTPTHNMTVDSDNKSGIARILMDTGPPSTGSSSNAGGNS